MAIDDLDLLPDPDRHAFALTDRLQGVVMTPIDVVIVEFFLTGNASG